MFNSAYFRKRRYLAWRAPIICSAIKQTFHPTSVIDFGCSIGDLVQGFNDLCIPSIGIDNSEELFDWAEAETPIFISDITEPLHTQTQFDLALCIEVLRFIPLHKLEGLANNIFGHSTRVLIGYGGEDKKLITETFESFGFVQDRRMITELKKHLEAWKSKPAIKALYYGGIYFTC
jgi:hypothetical protein